MSATKKPSRAAAAVKSRHRALEKMLTSLEKSVSHLQDRLDKAPDTDLAGTSKVLKAISDVLSKIYQIRYGKSAQEELLGMISDLQRHFRKAEEHSAERERRARSKPFVEIVQGMLRTEEEITANTEQLEEDTTARARDAQLEYESQLTGELDRAIGDLEEKE